MAKISLIPSKVRAACNSFLEEFTDEQGQVTFNVQLSDEFLASFEDSEEDDNTSDDYDHNFPGPNTDKEDIKLSDIVPYKPPGNAGLDGYRTAGYSTNKDRNFEYRPLNARGTGRDFGIYHQAFLESSAYYKGWSKIVEGLTTSYWRVKPVTCSDPKNQEAANKQAELVWKALNDLEGGFTKHVEEALYMLVAGFAPFIKIYDGYGKLVKLDFRFPNMVYRWITDEFQSRILGIEFYNNSGNGNAYYPIPAHRLVLYQYRALGNDWEGIPPLRQAYKAIQAQKLFAQLEAVAAEKYGSPTAFIERPDASYDAADDEKLLATVDAMIATDNPVILLPGGYKITLTSPSGQMPNFDPVKRYYDEQIASILTAEGSLLGLNGVGSYNLADIKDDQQLRSLSYYAKCICDVINGKGNLPYTGIIKEITLSLDEYCYPIEGQYPCLDWSLSPDKDDTNIELIINSFNSGLLEKTPEDEIWLRDILKVPQKREKQNPYTVNSPNLPEAVKAMSDSDKELWVKVFETVYYTEGKTEGDAFAAAYGAVKGGSN